MANDEENNIETPDPPLGLATLEQIAHELATRSVCTIVLILPKNNPTELQVGLHGNRFTILGVLEDLCHDLKTGATFKTKEGDGLGH